MSDDPTKELPQSSPFEARVLAEFAAIRGELAELRVELGVMRGEQAEIRVELGAIRGEQAEIRAELGAMRSEIQIVRSDIAILNARQERFEDRLSALEEKVDSRLSETRPIWESVLTAIEHMDMKLDKVILDLYDLRTHVGLHDRRLTRLEAR